VIERKHERKTSKEKRIGRRLKEGEVSGVEEGEREEE
jgi:hypothetical protein